MGSRILIWLAAVTMAQVGFAQVPPPPPAPSQPGLERRLIAAIESKNLTAYSDLLSDDVKVTDDQPVAVLDKREWLARFGRKLTAEGVSFKVENAFSSAGRLLLIEHFDSTASWGGDLPSHCCWSYDATAYDIADGKIVRISHLRGGSEKLQLSTTSPDHIERPAVSSSKNRRRAFY